MRDDLALDNNVVVLVGEVDSELTYSHEVCGENFYQFTLSVKRTSGQPDKLPVTISERLMDLSTLQLGLTIQVLGQVRTYNKFNKQECANKNKLIVSVFTRELTIPEELPTYYDNHVEIEGFVCKQPIYRKTPLGREICDILIAVNRPYGKSDYIPCIAWGRNARYASDWNIGNRVSLQGRLQSRVYYKKISDTESMERMAYEVSVNKLSMLEEKC